MTRALVRLGAMGGRRARDSVAAALRLESRARIDGS